MMPFEGLINLIETNRFIGLSLSGGTEDRPKFFKGTHKCSGIFEIST